MHFEDLLEEIGAFGRYQKLLCFILIPLTTGICGFTFYTQIFILTAPFHTCRLRQVPGQDDDGGGAETQFLNKVSSLLNATDLDSPARHPYACHQFGPNETRGNAWIANWTSLDQVSPPPNTSCINGWNYDQDLMFSTYTSEHDFVCDDAWRPYLVATAFWVGNTIGSWVFGFISDSYGRRPTVALSLLIYGVAGLASVFVSDFYGFMVLRILVGFSHHTVSHLPFVLVVEYCGLKSRVVPLLTIMMTYTLASIFTPLLALVLWDWRTLALITSIPALFISLLYRWIPESSSWLITRGRSQAARKQLETVARINGRELPYHMVSQLLSDTGGRTPAKASGSQGSPNVISDKDAGIQVLPEGSDGKDLYIQNIKDRSTPNAEVASNSILRVIKYPHLRKNIAMVLLVWMLSCMCYYGHCQNTAHLGSNIFLSYLLGAVVEIPSWSAPWLINRFGRRKPLILAFFMAGIASLLYTVLPQDVTWLVLSTALVGRASITGAYYITLQYGPEVFPTVVRGQGVALCETLGGVAIFLSPSIVYLGEFHKTAPLLVFGGLSVLAGAATLLLPETVGVNLPQTLTQAEIFSERAGNAFRCHGLKPEIHSSDETKQETVELNQQKGIDDLSASSP